MDRATIRQKKTGRPVRFELPGQTRLAVDGYLRLTGRKAGQYLFAGRGNAEHGLTTRQYARLVHDWVARIGLDPAKFGTHSLPRAKAVLIYRRTATCVQCNSCSDTPRLRAPFDTLASKSTMRSRSRRRSTSESRFTSMSGLGRRAWRGRRPTGSEWQLLGRSAGSGSFRCLRGHPPYGCSTVRDGPTRRSFLRSRHRVCADK